MDLGLCTEPWNSHTAHHARTVLFHSHNRDLYRDQAYNEKQGRLESEISLCHHRETLRILGQVLVTVHWPEKSCSAEYDCKKWFIFYTSQMDRNSLFLSEAYQRKAQTFLDKHTKKETLQTKFSLQINAVKIQKHQIAFYSHFKRRQTERTCFASLI